MLHFPCRFRSWMWAMNNDCPRFIESTINNFGGIDILINMRHFHERELKDTSLDVLRKVMDINFLCCYCTFCRYNSIHWRKGTIVVFHLLPAIVACRAAWLFASKFLCKAGWNPSEQNCLTVRERDVGVSGFTTSNIRMQLTVKAKQRRKPMDNLRWWQRGGVCRTIIISCHSKKEKER